MNINGMIESTSSLGKGEVVSSILPGSTRKGPVTSGLSGGALPCPPPRAAGRKPDAGVNAPPRRGIRKPCANRCNRRCAQFAVRWLLDRPVERGDDSNAIPASRVGTSGPAHAGDAGDVAMGFAADIVFE